MALVPPPNTAGVVLPANPQQPPTLVDISNSKEYVERLALSKRSIVHIPAPESANDQHIGSQIPGATATDNDIGTAERYHQEIVLTNTIMGAAPPQWLAQFMAAVPPPWFAQFIQNFNQMGVDINQMGANINQMGADINQIHAEMQAGFACIEARQANAGISRLNRLEMENNSGLIAYQAKHKVVSYLFLTLDHFHNSSCRLWEMVPHSLIPS
jgi:outer membrane murein-binding lipoprotein Lpp